MSLFADVSEADREAVCQKPARKKGPDAVGLTSDHWRRQTSLTPIALAHARASDTPSLTVGLLPRRPLRYHRPSNASISRHLKRAAAGYFLILPRIL